MDEDDFKFIRNAIEVARKSRKNGNHPFGSILVDQEGQILMEVENTVVTGKDSTGHSETNLLDRLRGSMIVIFSLNVRSIPVPNSAQCAQELFFGGMFAG